MGRNYYQPTLRQTVNNAVGSGLGALIAGGPDFLIARAMAILFNEFLNEL